MDRRNFIQKTTIGTVAGVMAFPFISTAQNQKLKIGLIGAGWYGMVITKAALETGSVEVIAVCDVDTDHLKASIDEVEKLQGSRPIRV
jgi:FlaA1/EpsC-like NDP-sugar epimerase